MLSKNLVRIFVAFVPAIASLNAHAAIDPFKPGAEAVDMGGKNAGQPLDTRDKRAVARLDAHETAKFFGKDVPDGILVKNVLHKGRFYVAAIPAEGPSEVIGQLEHFAPEWIAGHTQWRFKFERPIRLYRSLIGKGIDHDRADTMIHDVIFSAEFHAPKGVEYGLGPGMINNNFNLVHRMISLETKFESMIVVQGHTVDQIRIEIPQETRLKFLENALARAEQAGYRESYHTVKKSCTTEFFNLLDRTLGIRRLMPLFLARLPVLAKSALVWRKFRTFLMGERVGVRRIQTLNREFPAGCGVIFR